MILDAMLIFSKDQAITEDAASTNALDLGVAGDAVGQELTLMAMVTTAFAGTSTTTDKLQIKIQTSANNSDWTDVLLTPQIAFASLTKGAVLLKVRIPQGLKRYVRLYYDATIASAWSAGKITAFMSKEL